MLWETVLETPYAVDFEVSEVRSLTQEMLQESGDGSWPISMGAIRVGMQK